MSDPIYENGRLVSGSHTVDTPWGPLTVTIEETKCGTCGADNVILATVKRHATHEKINECLQCLSKRGYISVGFGRSVKEAIENAIHDS